MWVVGCVRGMWGLWGGLRNWMWSRGLGEVGCWKGC